MGKMGQKPQWMLDLEQEKTQPAQLTNTNNTPMAEFLPKDYKLPQTANSDYMKLKKGSNHFRILSPALLGWEDWKDKKPMRFPMDQKPDSPVDMGQPVKHFWAFVVWNYEDKAIQILQISQSTIQSAIEKYANNPKWGNPSGYDLEIVREGDGLETEYSVVAEPHTPLTDEIKAAYMEKPIKLEKLFTGDNPFEVKPHELNPADIPF